MGLEIDKIFLGIYTYNVLNKFSEHVSSLKTVTLMIWWGVCNLKSISCEDEMYCCT